MSELSLLTPYKLNLSFDSKSITIPSDVIGTYRSFASLDPDMIKEQMSYLMTPASQLPKPKGVGANVTSIVSNKLKGKFVKKVGSDKAIYLDSKELNNVSQ